MFIGKAGDVETVAHDFDHCRAVSMDKIGNVQGILLREALVRLLPGSDTF